MEHLARQEMVTILITFTVGFLAGGYLYLTEFTKLVSPDEVQDISSALQFTIVSEPYGGCGSDCPAFQVKNDGTYRYRYSPEKGANQIFLNGTLPRAIQRDLERSIDSRQLSAQSADVNPTDCPSFTDGIDIAYDITFSGVQYDIDSCGTAVDFNSDAWLALSSVWEYLGTVK